MRIVKADILSDLDKDTPTVILHGCNCFHTMGAGIARYLANKYPAVLAADKTTGYGDRSKLGRFSVAEIRPNLTILNCYTQYRYGSRSRDVDYLAVSECLRAAHEKYPDAHFRMPQIGCGLAKGDWNKVKSIIVEELPVEQVTVYYL